jgi:hypothetical protein
MKFIKTVWLTLFLCAGAPVAYAQIATPFIIYDTVELAEPVACECGRIRNLAIVVAPINDLLLRDGGFFSGRAQALNVAEWNLAGHAAAGLRRALSPRYEIKDVSHDPALLAKAASGRWSDIQTYLRGLPRDGLDAILVMEPAQARPAPRGLSLRRRLGFANFALRLVDANSLEILAFSTFRVRTGPDRPATFPQVVLEPEKAIPDSPPYTPEQQATMREVSQNLLDVSIWETLRSMKVEAKLPDAIPRIPVPTERDPFKDYKNVAIISVIGNDYQLVHESAFRTLPRKTIVSRPDWAMDARVEQRAAEALSKRFTIKSASVDRAALTQTGKGRLDYNIELDMSALPMREDIDLYVIFAKADIRLFSLYAGGSGLGVMRHITLLPDVTRLYAIFGMIVVDAHTGKVVTTRLAAPPAGNDNPVPAVSVNAALWPEGAGEAPARISEADILKLQAPSLAYLDQVVDETILRVGILGEMRMGDEKSLLPAPKPITRR